MCLSANQGTAKAQLNLGGLYQDGLAVKPNLAQAKNLCTQAANQGNLRSGIGKGGHDLGRLCYCGQGVAKELSTAAKHFKKTLNPDMAAPSYTGPSTLVGIWRDPGRCRSVFMVDTRHQSKPIRRQKITWKG